LWLNFAKNRAGDGYPWLAGGLGLSGAGGLGLLCWYGFGFKFAVLILFC
jgi:hypothetical protein